MPRAHGRVVRLGPTDAHYTYPPKPIGCTTPPCPSPVSRQPARGRRVTEFRNDYEPLAPLMSTLTRRGEILWPHGTALAAQRTRMAGT